MCPERRWPGRPTASATAGVTLALGSRRGFGTRVGFPRQPRHTSVLEQKERVQICISR